MSKEYLEALNYVWYNYYTEELSQNEVEEIEKNLNIVQDGLKRLESIDNAEPSDVSFIWLNQRITRLEDDLQHYTMVEKDKALASITEKELNHLTTIKQALLKAQKEHKALEIIKEKYPDVVEVKLCKDYEHYKLRMSSKHDTEIVKIDWNDISLLDYLLLLTEEEFNLLKEVLE